MNITSSTDISILQVQAIIDLSTLVPEIRFANQSVGAHLNLMNYVFEVYSPNNIPIHKGNFTTPDKIGVWTSHTLTEPLFTFQKSVEWSGLPYRVKIQARDSALKIFTLPEKMISLTVPVGNAQVGGNYAEGNVDVQVSCEGKEAFIRDRTAYSYQGVHGVILPTSTMTVIQPTDATGTTPEPEIFTGYSQVAFPLYIAGEGYKVVLQSTVDYDMGDDTLIRLKYIKTQKFNVNCNYDLCPLLYEFAKMLDQAAISCDDKLNRKISRINALMTNAIIAKMQPTCGVDLGKLIEEIKRLAGWNCNCNCAPPVGMNGIAGAAPGGLNIQFSSTSGDITAGPSLVNGNNILLSLKDFSYVITWGAATDNRAFSVDPVQIGGTIKTYRLNVNLDMLAADLLAKIGGTPALMATLLNMVRTDFAFVVDGKCVIATNPVCDYDLSIEAGTIDAPLQSMFKTITINDTVYQVNVGYNRSAPTLAALTTALNALNKGVFFVSIDPTAYLVVSTRDNPNKVTDAVVWGSGNTYNEYYSVRKSNCKASVTYTPSQIVQAMIDYMCKINATQTKIGYDFAFMKRKADGTYETIQFKAGDSFKDWMEAVNSNTTLAASLGAGSLTSAQLQALFGNLTGPIKATDIIYASRDGAPGQWTQTELFRSIIQTITGTNDSALKTAWCAAVNSCGAAVCNPVQYALLGMRTIAKQDFIISGTTLYFSGFWNSVVLANPYAINFTQVNANGVAGATGMLAMDVAQNKIDDFASTMTPLAPGYQWQVTSVNGTDPKEYLSLAILNNGALSYRAAIRINGSGSALNYTVYPAQPGVGTSTVLLFNLPPQNYESTIMAICGLSYSTPYTVTNSACPAAQTFSVIRRTDLGKFVVTYAFPASVTSFNLYVEAPNGVQNTVHPVELSGEYQFNVPVGVYGDFRFRIRAVCNEASSWFGVYSNIVTLTVPNTLGSAPTGLAVSSITTTTAHVVVTGSVPAGATGITLILRPTAGGEMRTWLNAPDNPVWDVNALLLCTQYSPSSKYEFAGGQSSAEFTGANFTTSCVTTPLSISSQPTPVTSAPSATFTLTVAAAGGTTPYTYQWQRVSVPGGPGTNIPGATAASFAKVGTESDTGLYRVVVTDSAGAVVSSNDVQVTISNTITVRYGYTTADPYIDDTTEPALDNQAYITTAHNANLSMYFSSAAVDRFLVIEVPDTESIKTEWYFNEDNKGYPGDATFRAPLHVGTFYYYVSRDPAGVAFNPSLPLQLRS